MEKNLNYETQAAQIADEVFATMATRVTPGDMARMRDAYEFASRAHEGQVRKSGAPYIMHPLRVALIVAREMMLDADSVIAAFLHDVVEDTPVTIDEIGDRYGDDVKSIVRAVTKQNKDKYEMSKQLDNFRQMLDTLHQDTRPLLVKLADRLHNMRTLDSMPPHKQMKIAGETDYFYAPLANRLGLYNIKIELENLGLRYRCPNEYGELEEAIKTYREIHGVRINAFARKVESLLDGAAIPARLHVEYRKPYSLWRKMRRTHEDLNHLPDRHYIDIVYPCDDVRQEKKVALHIYSVLSSVLREKPHSIINYIDDPKENGYQSFHVQFMFESGCWEEVHIQSERMARNSQIGCVAQEEDKGKVMKWIEGFARELRDIESHMQEGNFIEDVAAWLYNDDITVFTPTGMSITLPKRATALDFAYKIHSEIGEKARYAYVNDRLASVMTELHRGDVVEIKSGEGLKPDPSWVDRVVTSTARRFLKRHLAKQEQPRYNRCPLCHPIPGDEVAGFKDAEDVITLHKRNCPQAISLATQHGDSIVDVDFEPSPGILYPATIRVIAVDRYRLLSDMIDCITNQLHLSMDKLTITTTDCIVECTVSFGVSSLADLKHALEMLQAIEGIDEVKNLNA
ncbi:MAG: bifunctional (p)ppGpp synthetase/guanosine-3',5'-bis(diphosphate) 3'-pyrophosphohydrolase [Muribaculaceae bacterium]|nr:bifunctional (p)ppGpp synthetase/guanosine-3',5'-bis(diphosphate) 3'-pyrophosphohydrolase [Muribaculaceae bacterium]